MSARQHHAAVPALRALADRRAAMEARLQAEDGVRFASQHITAHIRPGAAEQERVAVAALLLAGTPFRVTPEPAP